MSCWVPVSESSLRALIFSISHCVVFNWGPAAYFCPWKKIQPWLYDSFALYIKKTKCVGKIRVGNGAVANSLCRGHESCNMLLSVFIYNDMTGHLQYTAKVQSLINITQIKNDWHFFSNIMPGIAEQIVPPQPSNPLLCSVSLPKKISVL